MTSQVRSDDLTRTSITAHLEAKIRPGKNLIYCASFQIAWDVLVDELIQQPLQLEDDPPIARALGKHLVGAKDIANDCYAALAGFERDGIIERVKQVLRDKFDAVPELDLDLNSPNDILAYAYLEKSIPFDVVFQSFDEPLVFSDHVSVESFGLDEPSTAVEQVVILDYKHRDEFIVKLQGSPAVDEEILFGASVDHPRITDDIILAKVEPSATLLEAIDAVQARIHRPAGRQAAGKAVPTGKATRLPSPQLAVEDDEVLQIPKIDFNVLHRFSELVGRRLLTPPFETYTLADALQAIKFRLNERGAELSSEAAITATFSIVEEPRRFIFDKPFLLCLKEKRAGYPYLAIWVDNSELLVKQ